jgi:hypothetical protein
MSDNPAEKKQGFERWVASLKLSKNIRSNPPPPDEPAPEVEQPLPLDEQATLINRIPKEVIYKLRERDSNRAMPKSDDSTAVFTPPPELLARARRFQAPPKPERSSPNSSSSPSSSSEPLAPPSEPRPGIPRPGVPRPGPPAAITPDVEAAAFASLDSDEEATTYFKPDIDEVPTSVRPSQPATDPPAEPATIPPPSSVPTPLQELSRPGDIQWIDGLASSPPSGPPSQQGAPAGSSIAPSERRVRWVALVVALLLLAGIFALSRMQ